MVKEYLYKTNRPEKVRKAKENARNNTNSTSCDDCNFINLGRDNNKLGIWGQWNNSKSKRSSR